MLLDSKEWGALQILHRIDEHVAKVDDARIRHRLAYRGTGKRLLRHHAPIYSPQERVAINFHRTLKRALNVCRACGNNRHTNPDVADGKCSVCYANRRKAYRPGYRERYKATESGRATLKMARKRRKMRIRNAPVNDLTVAQERWVFKLYGTNCLKCGASPVALDHVIPLAQGGPHTASNLQPLCWVCNSSKCARNSSDYRPFPYYSEIQ